MTETIITFEDRFAARDLHEHALRNPNFLGDRTPPVDGVILDVSTPAFVNGGRWIAQCPTDGCNGCEYVNFADPRFFCCECRNLAFRHVPILVTLPDERTRAQVEAYLVARPAWQTRHWLPEEPIENLRRENRVNGIRLTKSKP